MKYYFEIDVNIKDVDNMSFDEMLTRLRSLSCNSDAQLCDDLDSYSDCVAIKKALLYLESYHVS